VGDGDIFCCWDGGGGGRRKPRLVASGIEARCLNHLPPMQQVGVIQSSLPSC